MKTMNNTYWSRRNLKLVGVGSGGDQEKLKDWKKYNLKHENFFESKLI